MRLGVKVLEQPPVPASEHQEAQALAASIAAHTIKVLIEGKMLETEQLENCQKSLSDGQHGGQCVLRLLFPEEEKLEQTLRWFDRRENRHIWGIAHRIPPPETFYKAHPRILAACKLCEAVILDASNPSTMTTGSVNPLSGDFLARWIQDELRSDLTELRPRFFSHVVIPLRLWPGIMRSHFRYNV